MFGMAKCEEAVQANCRVITIGNDPSNGDFKADFELP